MKKSFREMETALALAESTALKREYITLRDLLKGMKSAWCTDVEGIREDMHKQEEALAEQGQDDGEEVCQVAGGEQGAQIRSAECGTTTR